MATRNPYVGPKVFHPSQRKRFFGREAEARSLLSLVLSERLILFHAPSGAGKSSLINARLVPCLHWRGYYVLPVARVRATHPAEDGPPKNDFVYNLLSSLDESLHAETAALGTLTLPEYLHSHLNSMRTKQRWQSSQAVLIIDQFEEIFTTAEQAWQKREAFFDQLRLAVLPTADFDPMLRVVIAMREDYVAQLAPFAHLLPGKLNTRFYMQPLDEKAARVAIAEPAQLAGHPFAEDALDRLVGDLLKVKQNNGAAQDQGYTGQFVQPLQLQVVCSQLWDHVDNTNAGGPITLEQVTKFANVDGALTGFYEDALRDILPAAKKVGKSESELREWFGARLIAESTRTVIQRQEQDTGGLPNTLVDLLVERRLIQSTSTASGRGTYYELIHDRFIDAVQESNRRWRRDNPLLRSAEYWEKRGRPVDALLTGEALKIAERTNYAELGELVKEFIAASRLERDKQQQRASMYKAFVAVVGFLCVLLMILTVQVELASWQAHYQENIALAARSDAEKSRDPLWGLLLAAEANQGSDELQRGFSASLTRLLAQDEWANLGANRVDRELRLRDFLAEWPAGRPLWKQDTELNWAHAGGVTAIEFDPAAPITYTAGNDGRVLQWGQAGNADIRNADNPLQRFTSSDNGEVMAIKAMGAGDLWVVVRVPTGAENERLELHRVSATRRSSGSLEGIPLLHEEFVPVTFAHFDASGQWLAWGDRKNWQIYDLSQSKPQLVALSLKPSQPDDFPPKPAQLSPPLLDRSAALSLLSNSDALALGAVADRPAVLAAQGQSISLIHLDESPPSVRKLIQEKPLWDSLNSLQLSADNRWLLAQSTSGFSFLYDMRKVTPEDMDSSQTEISLPSGIPIGSGEPIVAAAFPLSDSNWLALSLADGGIQLWRTVDSISWLPVFSLNTQQTSFNVLHFSNHGRWLFGGSSDGAVYAWRLDLAQSVGYGVYPYTLSIPGDGATALAWIGSSQLGALGRKDELYTWDLARLNYPELPIFATATTTNALPKRWLDGYEASLVLTDAQLSDETRGVISGDGRWAVLQTSQDAQACLIFVDRLQENRTGEMPCYPFDGKEIVAVAYHVSQDQKQLRLAVGDSNGTIWRWERAGDAGSGWRSQVSFTADSAPACLAFSDDGTLLGSVDAKSDKLVLFNVDTGDRKAIDPHAASDKSTGVCSEMIFSPDGRYLAVGTKGAGLWLWTDVHTANPQAASIFNGQVDDLVLGATPDQKLWLAALSADAKEVRLWRLPVKDLMALSCEIVNSHMTRAACEAHLGESGTMCKTCFPGK